MKQITKAVLILLALATVFSNAQSSIEKQSSGLATKTSDYWVDPGTRLMWTARDNGKNVSWKRAGKYCRDLRFAGYSDWKLPSMSELQGIFDKALEVPGLAGGQKKLYAFTWHVKGNLFLTGDQWSSNFEVDDRRHYSGYADYFDFNEGISKNDPSGWPYSSDGMRALCVRSPAK